MATTLEQPRFGATPERGDLLNRWLTRAYSINWELVLYVAIFVVAVFTRFSGLGDRVMSHDESLHTQFSYYLFRDGNFRHDPLMHGPILFHMTALSYFLFGDNDFVARIYPALLGVMMVMFPLLFRRWLGKTGAILASIMILISPLLLYYHRYIREDTPSILATMIMVYCTFMYLDGPARLKRKAIWLYIFSGAMLWSLASKEVAFMYVAIFGLFLTLYWISRLIQHFFHVPARTFFTTLILSILIAGIASMVMFAVLQIAFSSVTVPERLNYITAQFGLLFSGQPVGLDFSSFVAWSVLLIAAFVALLIGTMVWAYRRGNGRFRILDVGIIIALALAFSLVLIVIEERSFVSSSSGTEVAEQATPSTAIFETDANSPLAGVAQFAQIVVGTPVILVTWIAAIALIALLIYSRIAGWWNTLHRFPELDILMIMGTFILPWLAAAIISLAGANPVDYSQTGILRALAAVLPLLVLTAVAGVVWNWRRWLVSAAVFYILFAFFFTTLFTNPQGLATGMIGSLGYWLEQQGDRRGSQPQYYYSLIIMPMYEFLPLVGGILAMFAGMVKFWTYRERWSRRPAQIAAKRKVMPEPMMTVGDDGELVPVEGMVTDSSFDAERDVVERIDSRQRRSRTALFGKNRLRRVPFTLFVSFWIIFIYIAYTLAGEKMPWLATHITLPMILLAAWYFGRVFENVDWAKFRQRGWLLLLILPVLFAAGLQIAAPFIIGQSPFDGLAQSDLSRLGQWIAVIVVAVAMIVLIARIVRVTGGMHLRRMIGVAVFAALAVLTFRAAWMAAFINYDYANEYLVYAHGAPGIKTMVEQIEEISRRTTDSMSVRFAWGGNSWPVTWYFRNFDNAVYFRENPTLQNVEDAVVIYVSADVRSRLEPLLEDRYYRYEYMRMWWPDQEYFNLSAQRVVNTFDFAPENTQAAQIRHGMWDIWWSRDHTRYGEAIDKDYSFSNWPVSEQLYFYVRKDIAAQVWDLGIGDGTVMNPIEQTTTASVCAVNYQQLYASLIIGDNNTLGFNHPLDVEVAADGTIYVADEFSNRVAAFDQMGQLVNSFGGVEASAVTLNRPNGIGLDAAGNVFIADTWNFRVQSVSPAGNPLLTWGQRGEYGIGAQIEPTDGLWAPRDIEVDAQGLVYLADTGNKRIRVYNADGQYVRDISVGGSGPGQVDEPSGLAVDNNGLLFVADTWNRRVSVFNTADGTFAYSFPVVAWLEDLGNRPYLAVDATRNLVYVTDPDAARVLVYDTQGNCIGSFGQPGRATDGALDASQFDTPGGIGLDSAGNVYVTDVRANRVLRFAPFLSEPVTLSQDAAQPPPVEATAEVSPNVIIPEATTESGS